jgi:6-phosphogluconolactonase
MDCLPLELPTRLPGSGAQLLWVQWPADQIVGALASDVAERLRLAIAQRGQAHLCVSGGKSPVALMTALSRQTLDWSRVQISLADERCVPTGHRDSNAALVREHLLQHGAARARFVPLVKQAAEPLPPVQVLADQADQAMRALGPADVLILGMGADGHTASIFPGMTQWEQAIDAQGSRVCLPVQADCVPAQAPYPRITQTLAQLLKARHIVLPVAGADKIDVLKRACGTAQLLYPISHVLHQTQAPVAVWMSS